MESMQLQIVAQSVAEHLSKAGKEPMPDMRKADGTALVPMMALAGDTIYFKIGTLFGEDVFVTVSAARGKYGG